MGYKKRSYFYNKVLVILTYLKYTIYTGLYIGLSVEPKKPPKIFPLIEFLFKHTVIHHLPLLCFTSRPL